MTSEEPTTAITCPIFVFADDLSSFDAADDVTASIEPWDVAGVTAAFDAVGRRLVVAAEGVKRTRHTVGGGTTTIVLDPESVPSPSALRALLLDHVARVGPDELGLAEVEVGDAPLELLVEVIHRVTNAC